MCFFVVVPISILICMCSLKQCIYMFVCNVYLLPINCRSLIDLGKVWHEDGLIGSIIIYALHLSI